MGDRDQAHLDQVTAVVSGVSAETCGVSLIVKNACIKEETSRVTQKHDTIQGSVAHQSVGVTIATLA